MTRIVLWAAGGSTLGLGHVSRTRSLGFALQSIGFDVRAVVAAPAEIVATFSWGDLPVHIHYPDSILDEFLSAHDELLLDTAVLIVDDPRVTEETNRRVRGLGIGLLVGMTDEGSVRLGPDLFFNGDIAPVFNCPTARTQLAGQEYHIVRPEVVARRPPSDNYLPRTLERVLVSFGGADPGELTEKFTAAISDQNVDWSVTVVVGSAFSEGRAAGLLAHTAPGVTMTRSADLAQAIFEHDAVLTLPGLTAYEALCMGRLLLLASWGRLAAYGLPFARMKLAQEVAPEELRPVVDSFATRTPKAVASNGFRAMCRRGYHAIDGLGAYRVAKVIAETITEVR